MTYEDKQALFDRLRSNGRLREIIEAIKAHSGDDVFLPVVQALTHVPELWIYAKQETAKKKTERRQALAKKLRSIAKSLDDDPDARWFRISSIDSIFTTPIENSAYPTLSEYLKDVGEMLDDMSAPRIADTQMSGFYDADGTLHLPDKTGTRTVNLFDMDLFVDGKKTTRMTLKEFAKREAWNIINSFPLDKSSPNAEIAEIVNILLNLSPEDSVSANDIAKMSKPICED